MRKRENIKKLNMEREKNEDDLVYLEKKSILQKILKENSIIVWMIKIEKLFIHILIIKHFLKKSVKFLNRTDKL